MPRYVAFLRAINVGGRTVKMAALRPLFESLGLAGVETLIASGNVVFASRAANTATLERRIERQLHDALGFEVATFLRSPEELAAVVAHQPFAGPEPDSVAGHTLSIGFLKVAPGAEAVRRVEGLGTETDELRVQGRELYWLCRTRMSMSKILGPRLERALGMPTTLRNVTTVRKLAAKFPGSS